MKVLKFGGTSVGTVDSLTNVKAIVEAVDEPAIVVVSALGGITDRLIATARLAESATDDNPDAWAESFDAICRRHHDVIDGIVMPQSRESVRAEVDGLLSTLRRLYTGVAMLNDLSERVLDRIVSFGERMSTAIVGGTIRGIRRVYSPDFIRTETRHGKNRLDNETTLRLIADHLDGADKPGSLILTAGFISADAEGHITNLGRGGSDYTAAILAAAFNADLLEIWTDVDGFLTADPRKIPTATVIDSMSFVEAMELCNFGAKVVYPPTIYPVFHKNIPIDIKNTFNPSAKGTRISDSATSGKTTEGKRITGISSIPSCSLITIDTDSTIEISSLSAKAFNAMARKGIDVFLSANRTSGNSVLFVVRGAESATAMDELSLEFAPEIASGKVAIRPAHSAVATIAAVGDGLDDISSVRDELGKAIIDSGISLLAHSEGTSGSSVAFVVDMSDETKALKALHNHIFENQNP